MRKWKNKVFRIGKKILYKIFMVNEYNGIDWWFKKDKDGNRTNTMRQFGKGEMSKISSERFHGQSRREYYIDKIWRFFALTLPDIILLKELRYWLSYKKNMRAFYKARKITLKSWTVFNSDGERGGWDGWIEFKGGKIGLDGYVVPEAENVAKWNYPEVIPTRDEWNEFGEIHLEEGGRSRNKVYFDMIYIPCDILTPEILEEAIKRWYQSKVRWKYRHWTWKEQSMPEIVIDVPWESYSKEHGIGSPHPSMHALNLDFGDEEE